MHVAGPKLKLWIAALVTVIVVVMTAVVAWTWVTAPLAELRATILYEQHRAAELKAQIDSLSEEASAATAAAADAWNAAQQKAAADAAAKTVAKTAASGGGSTAGATAGAKRSFTTYAYVRKMTGPTGETFTVYLDTFQILTGAKATAYAKAHGEKVPSNGILYANDDKKLTYYKLADAAKITAYTGGVEAMTPLPIQAGKLQQWVSDPTVIPDASSDMWQVVIKNGVITTIKMIAVAG